jgi:hypothetical protein
MEENTYEIECSLLDTAPLGCTASNLGGKVLFAGGGVSSVLRCSTFDPQECKLSSEYVDAKGTTNRIGHAACVVANSVYLFGGLRHPRDATYLSNVSTVSKTDFGYRIGTTESTSPVPFIGATAVAVGVQKDRIAIFGGQDCTGKINSDLWLYSPFADPTGVAMDAETEDATPMGNGRWTKVVLDAETLPSARSFHAACAVGTHHDRMIVFGGRGDAESPGEGGEGEGEDESSGESEEEEGVLRKRSSGARATRLLNDMWSIDLRPALEQLRVMEGYDSTLSEEEGAGPPPAEPNSVVYDGAVFKTFDAPVAACAPADEVPALVPQFRAFLSVIPVPVEAMGVGTDADVDAASEAVPQPVEMRVFGGVGASGRFMTSRLRLSADHVTIEEATTTADTSTPPPIVSFELGDTGFHYPIVSGMFSGHGIAPSIRVLPSADGAENSPPPMQMVKLMKLIDRARRRKTRVSEWSTIMTKVLRVEPLVESPVESLVSVEEGVTNTVPVVSEMSVDVARGRGGALQGARESGMDGAAIGEGGFGDDAEAEGEEAPVEAPKEGEDGRGVAHHAAADGSIVEPGLSGGSERTAEAAKVTLGGDVAPSEPKPKSLPEPEPFAELTPSEFDVATTLKNGDNYVGQVRCVGSVSESCPMGDDDLLSGLNLLPHGVGRLTSNVDGSIHEGCFVNGRPEGLGRLSVTAEDGSAVTVEGLFGSGQVAWGKYSSTHVDGTGNLEAVPGHREMYSLAGLCRLAFKLDDKTRNVNDGDVFEGAVVEGLRHGQGKFTGVNGSTMEGSWVDDSFTGMGRTVSPTGDVVEGPFMRGLPHGPEVRTESSDGVFKGSFAAGKRNGFGKMEWTNGQTYTGKWVAGCMCGHGKLTLATGAKYTGMFKDDKFEGHGEMVHPDGSVYSGDFVMGVEHGNGLMRMVDGSIMAVEMNWGCIVSSTLEKAPPLSRLGHENSTAGDPASTREVGAVYHR